MIITLQNLTVDQFVLQQQSNCGNNMTIVEVMSAINLCGNNKLKQTNHVYTTVAK